MIHRATWARACKNMTTYVKFSGLKRHLCLNLQDTVHSFPWAGRSILALTISILTCQELRLRFARRLRGIFLTLDFAWEASYWHTHWGHPLPGITWPRSASRV